MSFIKRLAIINQHKQMIKNDKKKMNETFITNTTESSYYGVSMSPQKQDKYKNVTSKYAQSNWANNKKSRDDDDDN